jgi:protease IV
MPVRIFRTLSYSFAAVVFLSLACVFSQPLMLRATAQSTQEGNAEAKSSDPAATQTKPGETTATAEPPAVAEKKPERTRTVKEKAPPKKQLRAIALSGSYDDLVRSMQLDPTALVMGANNVKSKSFYRLCEYLQELGDDVNVTHILFDLSDTAIAMNSAQLDELTRRVATIKAKGKKTIAWLESASNIHLAIAACCDEIYLADFGGVDMPSASLETMFYRDAMDLIGVKASVVRAGDFKGAVEPYTNPVMSEHLKKHYVAMLDSINSAQVSRIAKGRGLTNSAVRDLQKKRLLLPAEALAAGLVTKLAPYGSMKKTIQASIGSEIEWTTPKIKPKHEMSLFELMTKAMSGPKEAARLKEDTIAVLHLSGVIVDGKEPSPDEIVSGPMVKSIQDLLQDDRVKGVVVRVNSPGGSATASEAIRQALDELANKKPVVFSMGDLAASGGYWVTCIGKPIYAERGTITGSIGVFSLKLSLGPLFRRVGVHVESVSLDDSAAFDSIDRAWTEMDIENMQRFIDDVYDRFLRIASKSRNIPLEKIQTLAGGRVWSGEQAKQQGLIDELGGVDDCIAMIAKKANLTKYKILHRPDVPSGFDLFRMLDDPGENELGIAERSLIQTMEQQILRLLATRGFRLNTTRALIRSAFHAGSSRPQIWVLMPQELRIR